MANTLPHPCNGHIPKLIMPSTYILFNELGESVSVTYFVLLNLFSDGMLGKYKGPTVCHCLFIHSFKRFLMCYRA